MQIIRFPPVDVELAKELVGSRRATSRINQAVNSSFMSAALMMGMRNSKGWLASAFFHFLLLRLGQTIQTVIKTKANFSPKSNFLHAGAEAMCVQIICEFAINKILPNDVGLGNAFSGHFIFFVFYPRTIKNIHYNLQSKKRLRCNKKGKNTENVRKMPKHSKKTEAKMCWPAKM